MKGRRSKEENEIRVKVVERLRGMFPEARIIHELNIAGEGSRRIDVAAVTEQRLIGVEIKSAKDNLKRLEDQFKAYSECFHFVFVAAHEKHFVEFRERYWREDVASKYYLDHELFSLGKRIKNVWRFPEEIEVEAWEKFDPVRDTADQPRALSMLRMLWADELRQECLRHDIEVKSRATRATMINNMVWNMTGKQVVEAVCRQLRSRPFNEADDAIKG